MEDSMHPNNKHSNLDSSPPQAQAVIPDRSGRQLDGIPSIGALRLVSCLKSSVLHGVDWISRWHHRRIGIRKLQALNDHYLKDIGLDRSEVVSYVEEIIVMDARPKFKAGKNGPNEYSNRSGLNDSHVESIKSIKKKSV